MYVQIKDNKNFYRDVDSKALVNVNAEELKTYYAEREIKMKEFQEKQKVENKVDKLEQDVSEIKNLLQQLLAKP
jgi:hypothetical protein